MIEEKALALIQETAKKSVAVYKVEALSDSRNNYVFDGTKIVCYQKAPPLRSHTVHSLVDLINYALGKPPVDEGAEDQVAYYEGRKPVVWHGENNVTLILDDTDRRDTVVFPLTFAEKFQVLQALHKEKPYYTQQDFIKLLRFRLGLDNSRVVAQFRKLQWEAGSTLNSQINRGDARLGKNIIEKVEGVDELPEELDVPAPVYAQTGEREQYNVRCGIEIDTRDQRFQLIPLPDELPRVMDLAQASIHQRLCATLKDSDIPIYYGTK